jgi:aryl-alcohol dehydrogenase-like predicted oxidoreductase
MKYRTLGRTGLKVSEIGFGCGTGAGLMIGDDVEVQKAAVSRALDRGITYFDTAPIYGDKRSEQNLGRALRELGANPVVITKVALELEDLDDIAGSVIASVEGSLERLGRDMVDVVYLHNRVGTARAARPDIGVGALLTPNDVLGPNGVVTGLESLRERGLVKFFGCCSYGGDMSALERLVVSDKFDAMLVHYNMLIQTAFLSALPGSSVHDYRGIAARAAEHGMGTAILRVLEGGLLAGKAHGAVNERLQANTERMRALEFLRDGDRSLASAAIRFALANPAVSTVLVGISEPGHVDAAVDAQEMGPLSAAALARIEAARVGDFTAS